MMDRKEILDEFYNKSCNEDNRFNSKHTRLEFLTTIRYIDKYLKKGDRILEVGAGTGAYSLHYASCGYKVDSIEYVEHNLDVLKSKIKSNMDINAQQGDAIDLSRYEDNTFDMVLVLGPLYHLHTDADTRKCISEAKRVCKNDGILMFAYLPIDSMILSWGLLQGNLKNGYESGAIDKNFDNITDPNSVMKLFYIDDIEKIMSDVGIKRLNNVSTSGIIRHFKDIVNNLSDEEFEILKNYHYSTCERKDLQGYSTHMLFIGKK